jgi:hypothetical protein
MKQILSFIAGYFWTLIKNTMHKLRVLRNIVIIINITNPPNKWELYKRGILHDNSKYRWSESKHIAKVVFKLRSSTYGSEEYKKMLASFKPAIQLHYDRNPHHPEHYKNGIDDMSNIDKIELICDWEAATRKHADGDIFRSIEINQERFKYNDEFKEWLIRMAMLIS